MGKRDFDNLSKLLQVGITVNGATGFSTEMDFELPRGFIAKIYKVILEWIDWHEDLETLDALEVAVGVHCALLRDPDDAVTVAPPENTVQHDVVVAMAPSIFQNPGDGGLVVSETRKIFDVPEHIDIITARNMRFNIAGVGPDVAFLTESNVRCEIYYTLEKVNDADILELLDIL